jgi:hypothetical protein
MKERLNRADISDTKLELDVGDLDVKGDTATAHCKRSEDYAQVEQSSYSSGDNIIKAMPTQRPGPTNSARKKKVKKSGNTWITFKRVKDGWVIDSMNNKRPR